MYKIHTNLTPDTKLGEVILEHLDVLIALDHLSIRLGIEEQSIQQIANQYNIQLESFIAILKVFTKEAVRHKNLSPDAVPSLLSFLCISHHHFKKTQIPLLQQAIHDFAKHTAPKHGEMLISFFDEYIKELDEHFLYEDEVVFPYIRTLLLGTEEKGYKIRDFVSNHTDIEQKLLDLKNILIKYIVELGGNNYRRKILYALQDLEKELLYHTIIEDELLVSSVKAIENSSRKNV